MRKLITLAVCLMGIGTSHAGLIVDRGVDRIRDERASFAEAIWREHGASNGIAELRRASVGPLSNYGAIKREYIKYSWNPRVKPIDIVSDETVSVPEPGTLALLALGLIAVGVARRRSVR